jgi:Dolichyl-phosphate-mannose-protein mannosyltransferase
VTAIALLFSVLSPVLIGWLLIRRLWTAPIPFVVELCLAPVLGLGVCSIEFFLWVAICGHTSGRVWIVEVATLVSLVAGSRFARSRRSQIATFKPDEPEESTVSTRGFSACFLLAAAAGVIAFVFLSAKSPEGGYDAWDHFAIKARFLFLGGDNWKRAFLPELNDYPDYPLMLPTTLARFWQYLGHETPLVQTFLAMLFTFGTVAILVSSLSYLRGKQQGLLAGVALLGTPFFITHGATQYPDVPLALLFLGTLVLLTLASHENRGLGSVALAGAFASIAAWTKNEGLALTFVVFVAQGLIAFIREGPRECRRQSLAFMAGTLPILIVLTWFKLHIAPANILIVNQGGFSDVMRRLSGASRYVVTGRAFVHDLVLTPGFGKWVVNLIPLMLLYGAVAGGDDYRQRSPSVLLGASVICSMVFTYFMVFVDLPLNLNLSEYLLYGSDRLFLQLWPSAVFVFFLFVRGFGNETVAARD